VKEWLSSGWSEGERSEPKRKTDDKSQKIGYVTLFFTKKDKEVRTHEQTSMLFNK